MDEDEEVCARPPERPLMLAYADPPYEGQASKYQREASANGRRSSEVDHPALIARLISDYPDGWALSCKTNSLRELLPLCPPKIRVLAWVKPFTPAYKGIRPTYSWEPVLLMGGRVTDEMTHDWFMLAPRMGLMPRQTTNALGGKPREFCRWVLDALGFQDGDTVDDLFPGTGMMSAVAAQTRLAL